MMSTELDPVSARKMSSIEHLLFYTESQLSQINSQLDERWGQIQDAQKLRERFVYKFESLITLAQIFFLCMLLHVSSKI